ncbi:recombinase family protein [Ectobacillus funiculus]|uniref:Recombinase family protein n=1 Tax=Ectobacillus funiculus TaxID=137993 RepID=A0ABV5WES4_9BACI
MALDVKNKIGVVGFSSHVNGKLVFRVNGNYEKNDIIQRFWDKNVSLSPEENLHESIDIIVDTVQVNNELGYQYMKKSIEQGDTLVIKSLDRLGRNQKEVRKEWEWYKDNKINIRVLDMPVLNREYKDENEIDKSINDLIRNLVFEIISWTDEETRRRIKSSQREGIEAAKRLGEHLGRPKIELATLSKEQLSILIEQYTIWKNGDITGVAFADNLKLKKNSFYKIIKEYEETYCTKKEN